MQGYGAGAEQGLGGGREGWQSYGKQQGKGMTGCPICCLCVGRSEGGWREWQQEACWGLPRAYGAILACLQNWGTRCAAACLGLTSLHLHWSAVAPALSGTEGS